MATELKLGIYHHIPFDEYKSWDAMNMSTLLWGRTSMQHMKAAIDGTLSKESEALTFGRAMHHYILERDTFEIHWQVAKPCSAILKSGDNKGEACGKTGSATDGEFWMCGTHAKGVRDCEVPDNAITAEQMASILQISEALKSHKVVKLLRQRGGCEASALFEVRGVLCKCRFDKLILRDDCDAIIDLKKVRSGHGEREKFQRHIYDYDYSIRAAFYADAVKALTGKEPAFIWCVVEDCAPHAVGVYQCGPESMAWGRFQYESLIGSYKNSRDTGIWPGYTTSIDELGLPSWVLRQYANELGSMAV